MSDSLTIDNAATVWNTPSEASRLLCSNPTKYGTNRPLVVDAVTYSGWYLQYASVKLKNDFEIFKNACNDVGISLQYASVRLRNTKEVVLVAVEQDALALQFASDELKDDQEIVTVACRENGLALEFASDRLRNTKEVVLVAVENCGWALEYASDELIDDQEVVAVACRDNGWALQWASERLRNTKAVVLVAVEHHGEALQFACDEMKNCTDVVCAALNGQTYISSIWRDREILKYSSANIKEKIVAFAAMVKDKNGVLRSLDNNDPLALSTHLQEKFSVRGIFVQLLHCGISIPYTVGEKRTRDDNAGRSATILPSLLQDIAGYAGVPVAAEWRQLRLVQEVLPLATAYAIGSGASWAALQLGATPG